MRCDKCHCREATIFIDANLGGEVVSLHLCQDCAGIQEAPQNFAGMPQFLQDFAAKAMGMSGAALPENESDDENERKRCDGCGLTLGEFRRLQRLGCESCYAVFAEELAELLPQLHRDTKHQGRSPDDASPADVPFEVTCQELREQLAEAVNREAYERAATLRDALADLERRQNHLAE